MMYKKKFLVVIVHDVKEAGSLGLTRLPSIQMLLISPLSFFVQKLVIAKLFFSFLCSIGKYCCHFV